MTLQHNSIVLVLTALYSMMTTRASRHNNMHCCNDPARGAVAAHVWGIQVCLRTLTSVPEGMSFLFRRVRKIAKSDYYLRHVRLPARIKRLSSHWTDFDKT